MAAKDSTAARFHKETLIHGQLYKTGGSEQRHHHITLDLEHHQPSEEIADDSFDSLRSSRSNSTWPDPTAAGVMRTMLDSTLIALFSVFLPSHSLFNTPWITYVRAAAANIIKIPQKTSQSVANENGKFTRQCTPQRS